MLTVRGGASRLLLAASLLLVSSTAAVANPYDLFGFNPRAISMGGAMVAAARDYTTTYYNPGAMTVGKQMRLGLGVSLTLPELYVDREIPDGEIPDGDDVKDSVLPGFAGGVTLGWLYPLGGIFEDKLALGVSLYLPIGRLLRVQGFDRQRPQFYMYQNLQDKLMFLAAVAFEPVEWFSFGGGIQVLADLTGRANLDLDIVDGRFERREFTVDITPTAAPIIGMHFRPVPGLSLGAVWRGSSQLSFALPVRVAEGEAFELELLVAQTVLYSPHQIAVGASYDIDVIDLTVSLDLTVMLWSLAPDPSPRLRVDVAGTLLEALGLQNALDISARTPAVQMGFIDTANTALGVEWHSPLDWFVIRAGYQFRPTPAPRATGATAYLDNDAHVLSLGAGFTFLDPLKVHVHPLTVDLAVQSIVLPRRTVLRSEPGDPIGDLSHGGVLWSMSLAVSHAW